LKLISAGFEHPHRTGDAFELYLPSSRKVTSWDGARSATRSLTRTRLALA
jgi:hypothetical protein